MKFSFDRFLIFVVLSLDDSYKIDSFLRRSMEKGSLSVNKMTSTLKKSSLFGGSLLFFVF